MINPLDLFGLQKARQDAANASLMQSQYQQAYSQPKLIANAKTAPKGTTDISGSGLDAYLKAQRDLMSSYSRANQQVYAPSINLSAINSQARASAENAVNPFYTKQLNDFLAQQAALKSQKEQQAQTDIQLAEQKLKDILGENQVKQARTTEDVALNQEQINTTADQFQTDTGTQANVDRLAMAKELAAGGSTGGLAAQKQETAQAARNTTEGRQEQQFQQKRQEQEIFKARTFEDLGRAGEQAGRGKEQAVKQTNFDLQNYITNQGFENESKKSTLEAARLSAIAEEQSNQRRLQINNFISSISNPAQRQAALQAYGGIS